MSNFADVRRAVYDVDGLYVESLGDLLVGNPTVLVHGVGSDASRWDSLVAELVQLGPVIRYDLRGHGRSRKLSPPDALETFVADHLRILARLGVGKAHHIGMSLGGMIVQAVAARRSAVVDKLVILSAVAGRTPPQRDAVLKRLQRVEEGGPAAVADGGVRWYSDAYRARHGDAVKRHVDTFLANDPVAYAASFRVLATNDLLAELSSIKAETLVMTGSEDVGSPPEMAQRMGERIPACSVVIVEGAKHALLEEADEVVARTVSGFLRPSQEVRQSPPDAFPKTPSPSPGNSATDVMQPLER